MSYLKDKLELKVEEAEFKVQQSLISFPPFYKWFTIIGALAVIPAFFVVKFSSQAYWSSRYDKMLINAKPSFENPEAPTITKTYLTTSGPGTYSAVLEITNHNLELSAAEVPYKAIFLTENKDPLYVEEGKLFLLPAERKYLVIPKITTTQTIKTIALEISDDIHWQKKLSIPKINIVTQTPRGRNELSPVAYVVEGSFQNRSYYHLKAVTLKFVLYDKTGGIIAASKREEFDLAPNERRAYRVSWPGILADNVDHIDVLPETNVLNKENITVPAVPSNPSSDLDRETLEPQ